METRLSKGPAGESIAFCSNCRTNVQTKNDFSVVIVMLCVVLILAFGIGLLLLLLYVIWVVLKGQVCTVCGSKIGSGPFPLVQVAAPAGAGSSGHYAAPPAPAFCSGCGSPVTAAFCGGCGTKNW